jgi:phage gp36-like protein
MSYASATELIDRFDAEEIAQRVDRSIPRLLTAELLRAVAAGADLSDYTVAEQSAAAAALASILRALTDADSTVDGYISSRVAVPLSSPPIVVSRLACDLARYFLYDDQVTETIQKRYDTAIAFFRDVASGRVSLGIDPGASAQPTGGTVEVIADIPVFGRKSARDFI